MAKKFNLPISIFELIVYTLGGLVAIWGVVYIALGVSVNFLKYDHALVKTNADFIANTNGMGFLQQGILILSLAVIALTVFLLGYAKKADRQYEKAQRRAAARTNRRFGKEEVAEEIVEVESTPVE